MTDNGIDEEIDIDVVGIHQKEIASIISALFQIFSIISVFSQKEWHKAIEIFEDDEDQSILDIIDKIGNKLREEIQNKKNSRRGSQVGSSKDIVNILKDLEQKDQLLKQNETELWDKTNRIKELEQALEKTQQALKQQKIEYEAMERRKDETINSLENHFYDKRDNKEMQVLKDENQNLEDNLKDYQ